MPWRVIKMMYKFLVSSRKGLLGQGVHVVKHFIYEMICKVLVSSMNESWKQKVHVIEDF